MDRIIENNNTIPQLQPTLQQEATEQLFQFKQLLKQELQNATQIIANTVKTIQTDSSVEWRTTLEYALQQSEPNSKKLAKLATDFHELSEKCAIRLEHITTEAEKRIAKLLTILIAEEGAVMTQFKKSADESYNSINGISIRSLTYVKKLFRRIHWYTLSIAFFAAMCASLITTVYVNAQWPWESNIQATHERHIGQVFLSIWPTLSNEEQQQIRYLLGLSTEAPDVGAKK